MDLINESRKEWLSKAFRSSADKIKRVKTYKVWQDGNHPIQLESNKFIVEKLDYIHQNPVENEITDEPEWYLYSSARDYAGKMGLLAVELLH
ncbi:MAG: hypothetical protein ABJH72_23030 [Reichenbachiella sp.]|uniref:hypothetical protein n=1 Tax=Reichenbachiella sp. TaxID=2184521 RepID=UPI003262F4EE